MNESRIHAIVRRDDNSVFFASTTPPEKARDTNTEVQGRLLATGKKPYVGLGAPTVSPGGTRFVMLASVQPTNNAGQYTAASTQYTNQMLFHFAEGAPIQTLAEVDAVRLPLFHTSGGALYELVVRATQLQVDKWSDATKSFTPLVGGAPVQYPPQASALVGTSLFALERQTNRLALWRAPDIAAPVFTDLLASKNVTAIDDQIGLAGSATDVVVLALQFTGDVHILRFAQDGTQLDDVKATLPMGAGWETYPKKLARHGDDLLLMQRSGNDLIRILKWSPGATSFTVVSVIDDPWLSFTSLVPLPDGRLVFALQRNSGPDRWQAAIRVSSDGGVTWDAPVPVRPRGGYGQHVWGLSVDPTSNGKDLLLLMGDNASMRGFSQNDIQLQTSEHLMPTPDKVLVRVTVP
ncbi:MAG: exo-alpha-sialidase [Polyangiaceae bacterium]|nr:exo-alpha-sialidase [Polyangiaceae bacterium]